VQGDNWWVVEDPAAARATLVAEWSRVFLCLGRAERTAFSRDRARHYLVRSRRDDPAREGLTDFTLTAEPGPFTADAEADLMRAHRIDALVTRDAGGEGAYPKIEGARMLGLPVVLIARPPVDCPTAASIAEAAEWLASL
jgi:precorrin-6A/cobalt-precorrin-6A reductase